MIATSYDGGWPTLTGEAGSLTTLLRALLVEGGTGGGGPVWSYPESMITSDDGSHVIVTHWGHGIPNLTMVTFWGADEEQFNITAEISYIDEDHYSYYLEDTGLGPDYPANTSWWFEAYYEDGEPIPGLGWFDTAFDTDKAAFSGDGIFSIGIDDTGDVDARVRGYVGTMYSAGAAEADGDDPFPTDAQVSGGLYAAKSETADGTPRTWLFVGDDQEWHLVIEASPGLMTRLGVVRLDGDYGYLIEASEIAGDIAEHQSFLVGPGTAGAYIARAIDDTTVSQPAMRLSLSGLAGPRMGAGPFAYPAKNTRGFLFDEVAVCDQGDMTAFRGMIPSLRNILHSAPFGPFITTVPILDQAYYFGGWSGSGLLMYP